MALKQDYSSKTVCVVDLGLFVEVAVTLSEHFGQTLYHYPWQSSPFPRSNSKLVGKGLGNVQIADYLWDIVDEVDLFVFPDIFLGDLQQQLVRMGKRVFGSRRGEELEMHRAEAKRHYAGLGLPVGPYEVCKGMDELRDYLKEHDDQYVKISVNRGDFETFEAPNYKFAEPKLDELESKLGAKGYTTEFICEDEIKDAVEIGYDGFCIDGQYPAQSLVGVEVKNKGYLGRFVKYADLPPEITDFNTKIAPTLAAYQYRNFYSTELRVTQDRVPYMIDLCCRCGSPPTEVALMMYENLPDVMWFGAEGVCVDPESSYEWGAEILIESSWADKYWQAIQFPEELRPHVKMRNLTKINDQYYVVPQSHGISEIGAIVSVGHTAEEAIESCKAVCEQVKGYFIETFPDSLDTAKEELQKLSDMGVKI
jgi:hypothetical protein